MKPLPFVLQSDFEDRIRVAIRNNGTGPLILQRVLAKIPEDGLSGHLIDLIPAPPLGLYFANFNKIQQARAILPNDQVDLIDLPVVAGDATAVAYRNELRKVLGNANLEITYTDVYETRFPVYAIKLGWFHRHFNVSS